MTNAEKSARYRAKDIEGYRAKKNALAKLPHYKAVRAAYARKWRAAHRKPPKPRKRRFTDEEIRQRRNLAALKFRMANREKLRIKSREAYYRYKADGTLHDRMRAYSLKKKYKLTVEAYDRLFESQGRQCGICGIAEVKRAASWHVDHCHETGKVRGILCHVCNTKLGWYEKFRSQIEAYVDV